MASSGSFGTSNPYVKYTVTITQNSQNISANTSNVTVSVRFFRTNTGYETWGSGTIWCKIDGTTYTASIQPHQKITSSGIVLFSKTLDIRHTQDGTKHLVASAWINMNSPLTSNEQAYGQDLTRIARATTPVLSPSEQEIGQQISISLPRASTDFTHTVYYTFGSLKETIATNVSTSTIFTLPSKLSGQISNSNYGLGEIIADTYQNGNYIGSGKATFTATIPDGSAPVIESVDMTDTNYSIYSKFGTFVAGKSKMNVTVRASGTMGSDILSCTIMYDGQNYNGLTVQDIPIVYGSNTLSVTVRDTRYRETTKTYTVNTHKYDPPQIQSFSVERCNNSGTPDDEGENLLYKAKFVITSCNSRNDKSYRIEYKTQNSSQWNSIINGNVYSYDSSGTKLGNLFNVDNTYIVRLTVSDYFGSITSEVELPTAFTLIDFHKTGKGVAFGGVCDSANFSVKMEAVMEGDVLFEKAINIKGSDGKNIDIAEAFRSLYDRIYPIGIIIAFGNDTDPNEAFKGTSWERTAEGRVIVGRSPNNMEFDTIGKTGGEKEHRLSVHEIPEHAHALEPNGQAHSFSWGGGRGTVHAAVNAVRGASPGNTNYLYTQQNSWNQTGMSGSSQPHNNLQPYQVDVYWIRTA